MWIFLDFWWRWSAAGSTVVAPLTIPCTTVPPPTPDLLTITIPWFNLLLPTIPYYHFLFQYYCWLFLAITCCTSNTCPQVQSSQRRVLTKIEFLKLSSFNMLHMWPSFQKTLPIALCSPSHLYVGNWYKEIRNSRKRTCELVIQLHRSNNAVLTSTSKPPKSCTFLNISIIQVWIRYIGKCAHRKATKLILKWSLSEKFLWSFPLIKIWGQWI